MRKYKFGLNVYSPLFTTFQDTYPDLFVVMEHDEALENNRTISASSKSKDKKQRLLAKNYTLEPMHVGKMDIDKSPVLNNNEN